MGSLHATSYTKRQERISKLAPFLQLYVCCRYDFLHDGAMGKRAKT